jgi:hypothetical protein
MERQSDKPLLGEEEQHLVAESLRSTAEKATTPLRRWERYLERPVALVVLPVFALANAGIPVDLQALANLASIPLMPAIVIGLLLGKVLGITFMTSISLRLGVGQLGRGVSMRHIAGIGLLGGMGFTMSIFIANLGFDSAPETLVEAKTAILFASLLAGISGFLWLRFRGHPHVNGERQLHSEDSGADGVQSGYRPAGKNALTNFNETRFRQAYGVFIWRAQPSSTLTMQGGTVPVALPMHTPRRKILWSPC